MSGEATISTEEDRQETYQSLGKRIRRLQEERRGLVRHLEEVEQELLLAMDALNNFQIDPEQYFQASSRVIILNKPYQDQEAIITGFREDSRNKGEDKVWNIKLTRNGVKTHRKQRFLRVVPTVEPTPNQQGS